MADTYIQDCKFCKTHTDCINGICMSCDIAEDWLNMHGKSEDGAYDKKEVIRLISLYGNL